MTAVALPLPDSRPRSGARAGLAAFATASLLLLMLQGRLPEPRWDRGDPAPAADQSPTLDVDSVVERAMHEVSVAPGGALEVTDPAYSARFTPAGFSYTPDGGSRPLAVSLRSVDRGGDRLGLDLGAWTADGNLAGRTVHPGVREQVTARDGEVEWDVVLASEPAGTGDLRVRAELGGLTGEPERVRSASGPAWDLGLAGGESVRMGEVVVVDATGQRLHRALPTIADEQVELRVPDEVLADATYPLTVDPTVGEPVPLTVSDSATGYGSPAVAFNGTDHLVVWHANPTSTQSFEIYAALVSGDGRSVGGALNLSTSTKPDLSPDVAWNGSVFLVVWEHGFSDTDQDVRGHRVTANGLKLGGVIAIQTTTPNQRVPAVAAAGSTFYVVWEDGRASNSTNTDIFGARVTNEGTVLDTFGQQLTSDSRNEWNPDVAWNGNNFLLSYEFTHAPGDQDVSTRLLNSSGGVAGQPRLVAANSSREFEAAVASDGENWLVVYIDNFGGPGDIRGARVNAIGIPNGTFPIATGAQEQSFPDVAFNGTYLVAWYDGSGAHFMRARRVERDGDVLDANAIDVSDQVPFANRAAVAPAPGGGWVVDHSRNFDDIIHTPVSK